MTEKVIHEFRIIETADGFRIEIKGDKEKLRKMGFGPAMAKFFGCGAAFDFEFPGGTHFGRSKRGGRRGYRYGPPWTWWDWNEEEDEPPKKA